VHNAGISVTSIFDFDSEDELKDANVAKRVTDYSTNDHGQTNDW
jgi:hypothetical protein